MERRCIRIFFPFIFFSFAYSQNDIENEMTTVEDFLQPTNLVLWPNGTIPFYINTDHFDNEQTLAIMASLSLLAFRTCLRFSPAMVAPSAEDRVLTLQNPSGARKCVLRGEGEPHMLNIGYDCLKAPWLDRIILRALGLPFEHNRANRDNYIDVQYENIEQHAIPLFTKDFKMPAALRALPYDINSVLHFGDRDYSKNGHRTIIFKDRETKQKREGMTDLDIRKIEIIYGPECQNRDRMEKIDLCHLYPNIPISRRKRSVDLETTRSLRVNPDITPPPEIDQIALNISDELLDNIRTLDIDDEVQYILDDVHKLSVKALKNARVKYCNDTEDLRRSKKETSDVLGIVKVVANYAQSMVDHAVHNLTSFCEKSESIEKYQRYRYSCPACPKSYYSTKHGVPYHSTKHAPYIPQSTTHLGGYPKVLYGRARDGTVANDTGTGEQQVETTTGLIGDNEYHLTVTEPLKPLKRYKRRAGARKRRPAQRVSEEAEEDEKIDNESNESGTGEREKTFIKPIGKSQEKGSAEDREVLKKPERNRQRKRPSEPALEEDLSDKETLELARDEKTGGGYGERKKHRKDTSSEFGVKRLEKETIEVYEGDHDQKLGERYGERKKHRKDTSSDFGVKRIDKETIEVYEGDHDQKLGERYEERKKQRKDTSSDFGVKRIEKETIEVYEGDHDQKLGERYGETKKQRKETSSEIEVKRLDKEIIEVYEGDHDQMLGERQGKKRSKKPTTKQSNENQPAEDTVEDSGEPKRKSKKKEGSEEPEVPQKKLSNSDDSDTSENDREVKRKRKRPVTNEEQVDSEEPDDEDEELARRPVSRTLAMSKANEEFYNQRRWPDGVVYYFIDRSSTEFDIENLRSRLANVNEVLRKRTCARIVEISESQKNKHEDYLVLDNSPDYVTGRVGGKQNFGSVELLKGGQHRQHTAMMVMAMLGFYFELARHDRDQYVKVHSRHVRADKLHHFEKLGEEATMPLPYDYKSATHPAWMFWRKIGKKGISTVATFKDKDPDGSIMKSLGQNKKLLSEGDIVKINTLYGTKCLNKNKRSAKKEDDNASTF